MRVDGDQVVAPTRLVIGRIEAGRHGRTHEGIASTGDKTRPLPRATGNNELDVLSGSKIVTECDMVVPMRA